MKKVYFSFFFLVFIAFSTSYSQSTPHKYHKNVFEIGVGMGASVPFGGVSTTMFQVDLNYHFQGFSFGWQLNQHLKGFGNDRPTIRLFTDGEKYRATWNKPFHAHTAIKGFIEYCPHINDFQPILGVGFGSYWRPEIIRKAYDINGELKHTSSWPKTFTAGLIGRVGIRFKRLTTLLEFNAVPETLSSHFNFVILHKLGFDKKWFPQSEFFTKRDKTRKEFLRIDVGAISSYPISLRYAASSFRFFGEIRITANPKFSFGIKYETIGFSNGYDKPYIIKDAVSPDSWFSVSRESAKISNAQITFTYPIFEEGRLKYYWGFGAGLFQSPGFEWPFGSYGDPVRTIGGSMMAGYQYAMVNVHASLNLPVHGMPIFFNIGAGFSLVLKKKPKDTST